MKSKIILFITLLILLFLELGCDETFSPYGEFQKRYYLNCIVRADTNLQITTLYQSYAPNNNNPIENREATFLHNSSIRLWKGNDEIYFLRDTTTENRSFYYSKGLKPKSGDSLEIEAILPDGNRLKSKTKVPEWVKKDLNKLTEIVPPKEGNVITFAWVPNEESQIFIPMLYIYYKEIINGTFVTQKKVVPWKYITEDGKEKGIHRPPLKNSTINYDIKNIEKALTSIGNNKNTENIIILSLILELRVFDKNLSAYYLSVGRINSNYSIRLDAKEFSNINGGYGIFGSFTDQKIAILFNNDYLTRFNFHQKTL